MPREPGWWYRPAGVTAAVLSPFGQIYGLAAQRRLTQGQPYVAGLPVVCVGNFTAGGTGKTPFTASLVRQLIAQGHRPAILTRGYGGSERGPHWVDGAIDTAQRVGDEPLLLVRDAPTLVARDRAAGARAITDTKRGYSVVVMDDGLQNPGLAKTLSFAIVDGARGLGNGCVIPAGPLRAPLAFQATLVDAIVVNGTPSAELMPALERAFPGPILLAQLAPVGDTSWLVGTRVLPFAGIGHPGRFFDMLSELGAEVFEPVAYGDHAAYSAQDAQRLLERARDCDAILVTTEKDLARMRADLSLAELAAACRTLPVAMSLDAASQVTLDGLVHAKIGGALRSPRARGEVPEGG
jgi:tetraacyldisaccharide 4'-kinase